MTIKDKMKTYNFWISLVSAILLVARLIASKFNVEIDSSLVMDITTGMCGIFVVLGIISAPTKPNGKKQENNVADISKLSVKQQIEILTQNLKNIDKESFEEINKILDDKKLTIEKLDADSVSDSNNLNIENSEEKDVINESTIENKNSSINNLNDVKLQNIENLESVQNFQEPLNGDNENLEIVVEKDSLNNVIETENASQNLDIVEDNQAINYQNLSKDELINIILNK